MLRIKKHIILVGNSPRHLIALQQRIREMDPETDSRIADICHIREALCLQQVDMILIYTSADVAHFPYVLRIRQEPLADTVAVVVFREPLEEEILKEMLNGVNR